MDKSTARKRRRESDEIEESRIKKTKSEASDVDDDELNVDKEEESNFLQLFTNVLDEVIKKKAVEDEDIAKSIPKMKFTFKETTFHELDFTQWENICAYLYRYASHGAGFSRCSTLKVIRNCEVAKNILKKSDLKVIFIGSGPGNDAVGFCSALAELQYPKMLKLTLVDKFKEWEECIDLVVTAIEKHNFGKATKLFRRENVKFIQAELPGDLNLNADYFEALKEADVIIASKLFSTLDRSDKSEIERTIIKSLYKHMKEDAVIFVNDTLVYVKENWKGFRILCVIPHHKNIFCEENEKEHYESTAHAEDRFNSNDRIASHCPVFAFVKESAKI